MLAAAGCGLRGTGPALSTKDSAGVTVVTNAADEPPRWTVDAVPAVILGSGATTEYQLDRVQGALIRSDGGILVADAGSHQVRLYAPDGRLEWHIGRDGDGPGEFRLLGSISLLAGDTVMAYDMRLHRASLLDPTGAFVSSRQVQWTFASVPGDNVSFPLVMLGFLDDHSSLVLTRGGLRLSGSSGMRTGHASLARFRPDGSPGPATVRFDIMPAWERAGERGRSESPPFRWRFLWAVHAGHLYETDGRAWRIDVWSPDGTLVRSIRERRRLQPVTHAVAAMAEALPPGMNREAPMPDSLPAIENLVVDHRGRVWAQEYQPDDAASTSWRVFDAAGARVGRVSLPPRTRLADVRDDRLLAIRRDTLDVETVVEYRFQGGE